MKCYLFILIFICLNIYTAWGKSTEELLQEAKVLREKGFNDSATAIYNEILKNDPNNIQAITDFAEEMLDIRNYAYALTLYHRYLELRPEDEKIRELIINIYISLNLYDMAGDECLTLLRKEPDNLKFIYKLKDIYREANLLKKEMAVTEKILELEPENNKELNRLLQLYIMTGNYEKAITLIEKDNKYPLSLSGYVYLNAYKYDKAIDAYEKMCHMDKTDENDYCLLKARLSEINYNLETKPRYYNRYYNPLMNMKNSNPQANELVDFFNNNITVPDFGIECVRGKNGNNSYSSYHGHFHYPLFSMGTDLYLTFQNYEISNDNLNGVYRQSGIQFRQQAGKYFNLSGGYTGGLPDNTYYGQIFFQSDKIDLAVRNRKDFEMQTPEALNNNISFRGMDYFINWRITDKINIYDRFSDYDYSDGNNGQYNEIGIYYRVWENQKNSWVDMGISHGNEKYKFISPLYYSPETISQLNYSIDWNYYYTDNSLLSVGYSRSQDSNGIGSNFYSIYSDHKCSDNFFIYGQYLNGISQSGLVGIIDRTNLNNYEYKMGLKYKF